MVTYYHGGGRGYRKILPASKTGEKCASDYVVNDVHRRDRVYITTIYEAALMYAAMHPSMNGVVYEVRPIGDIVEDPDYTGGKGESLECSEAEIIRVIKPKGKELEKIRKIVMYG